MTTGDELFNRVLARSLQDLGVLRSALAGRSYYSAGVPWYATLFGRDSLISATQVLAFEPDVAADTLRLLGGLLGREHDDARDEEPGKVLHELRVGEPATLGETPFARYYGTADATPLWLALLCDHADWSGNLDLFRELRPQVDAALDWVDRHGDLDGDGLIEYQRRAEHGLANQGWKDSWDGVPDAAGAPLEPPDRAGGGAGLRDPRAARHCRAVRSRRRPGAGAAAARPGRRDRAGAGALLAAGDRLRMRSASTAPSSPARGTDLEPGASALGRRALARARALRCATR